MLTLKLKTNVKQPITGNQIQENNIRDISYQLISFN